MAKRREVILGLSALGIATIKGSPGRSHTRLPQKVVTTELILTETALALGLTPLASGNLPLYRFDIGDELRACLNQRGYVSRACRCPLYVGL